MMNSTRVSESYELPDPELRAFDHGVGSLSLCGELRGHLASIVGRTSLPSREPWPWFIVVWLDGTREHSFEDYGPGWVTVRQLDAGYFEYHEPSTRTERRILGMQSSVSRSGAPITFDFRWLSTEDAARKWAELGLADPDF
jgi:hypothetical protein